MNEKNIPLIQCHQLTKRYVQGQDALAQVSMQINPGEMVFITGHSGAGKSTLLKLIASLEKPTQGDIVVNGKNLNRLSKRQLPYFRRQIGLIFQNPQLLLRQTVYQNVALPLVLSGFRQAEVKRRVHAALDKVDLLKSEKMIAENLSCGEQQRVGIARALVHRPILILADEPTGNLDANLAGEIMQLFEQFNQVGVTLLIATHQTGLINFETHRVLTLQAGQLISDTRGERYV